MDPEKKPPPWKGHVILGMLMVTTLAGCTSSPAGEHLLGSPLSALPPSGTYPEPLDVVLTSSEPGRIMYTLEDSGAPGWREYTGPIPVRSSTMLRVRAERPGGAWAESVLVYDIVPTAPLPTASRAVLAHPAPISQDISRTAFLHKPAEGQGNATAYFSTLETYAVGESKVRFLLYRYDLRSRTLTAEVVPDAREARSHAYIGDGVFALGTSLDPNVLLVNAKEGRVTTAWEGPHSNAFLHRLAVREGKAFAILSTPSASVPGHAGIVQIDLADGNQTLLPYGGESPQGWGGVESVDPSGRVWFYRAYPMTRMWYDSEGGVRPRDLGLLGGWVIESWDVWGASAWVVLAGPGGTWRRLAVDLDRMELVEESAPPGVDSTLFSRIIPVDVYHTAGPALANLYFDPSASTFYRRAADDTLSIWGSANLGVAEAAAHQGAPQEASLRWRHPDFGELEILGTDDEDRLIVWLRGRKALLRIDHDGHGIREDIDAPNLSPSDITSLAIGKDGAVYGGGILTMSHLFRFDPATGESSLLREAVPHAEGQINALFAGWDGTLYGAGYPDSVLFAYDPSAGYAPGSETGSNPRNLGPMGHYRQTRATRGVLDSDGILWFQSVTDYSFPVAHALARADLKRWTLEVKTDLADGIPVVQDITVFNRTHLLLAGGNDSPALYLLEQRNFKFAGESAIPQPAIVGRAAPSEGLEMGALAAMGPNVFLVSGNLGLEQLHRSPGPVTRIVEARPGEALLVGQRFLELLDLATRKVTLLASAPEGASPPLFTNLDWTPVAATEDSVYLADRERLWRYDLPAR